MSNSAAIAAVTQTLVHLITNGVAEIPVQNVTARPPEKARKANENQLNIFLYHMPLSPAWRNMDMPRQIRPGETGQPPLPLSLHYLITGYGQDDDEILSQQWLGKAISVLHDHPLLGAQEIKDALQASGLQSGLEDQIERVRITPENVSYDEMSKLWTAFQTPYRASMAYRVDVVLIESTRPARTPLPVLARGKDDSGVNAQSDLIPPFPTIEDVGVINTVTGELQPSAKQLSFELEDNVAILGHNLAGTDGDPSGVTVIVRLTTTRLDQPQDISVPAPDRSDKQITFQIPNDPVNLPAGFYTLSALVTPNGKPEETRTTNEWPLLLAPKIIVTPPITSVLNGSGAATIKLTCEPDVRRGQRVTLALGDREIVAEPHPTQTNTLKFVARTISAGVFRVRLRVDGVDSHLIDFSDPTKPKFDESQIVTITPA